MSNRRHVCILTTAHPTDDVRVNSRIADSFLRAGFRVTWVGPEVAYFMQSTHPDPRIEYRLFRANTSRTQRVTAPAHALRAARDLKNVDWWYSPDPDAGACSIRLARRNGGRAIFDIHEIFHTAHLDRWFPGAAPSALKAMVQRLIQRLCRRSDLVIGVNRAVMQYYVAEAVERCVVRNCAPVWFASEGAESGPSPQTRLRIMHGKAIPANGTFKVLDALSRLDPGELSGVQVVMFEALGSHAPFTESLRKRIASLPDPAAVDLIAAVPHHQVPEVLNSCQVGMIATQRELVVDSLPNRIFEYMATGMMVLVPEVAVEMVEIVEQEDCGISADLEDPAAIAATFRWMRKNSDRIRAMGARSRVAFVERYNWDTESCRMMDAMEAQMGPVG